MIRHIPTFASIAVLLLAAGAALRLPQRAVPASAIAYIFAQAAFVTLAWFVLQRDPDMRHGYAFFYSLTFGVVLLLVLTTTWKILRLHPVELSAFVGLGGLAYFSSIGSLAYWYVLKAYDGNPSPGCTLYVLQGTLLCLCGSVTLSTLFAPLKPEMFAVCLGIGGFWLSFGILSFATLFGMIRSKYHFWLNLNNFAPAFLAIVFFGWLAFQLSGLQSEGSLEALPEVATQQGRV